MHLGFGITFPDLYERHGLIKVDAAFLAFLGAADRAVADRLSAARAAPPSGLAESQLLIALAPHVEDFIAQLFGIEREARALAERHHELAPLWVVKRQFVQRRALHKVKPTELQAFDPMAAQQLFGGEFTELDFARKVTAWLANEAEHAQELEQSLDQLSREMRTCESLDNPGWRLRVNEYNRLAGDAMMLRRGEITREGVLDLVFEIRPLFAGPPPTGMEHLVPLQESVLATAEQLRVLSPAERG
jgi:hypothetical protein